MFLGGERPKFVKQIVHEGQIVGLHVLHRASHPREALTKPEIVRGIRFRRFARPPIPIAAVLKIHYIE